jgi:hypothetical protein
LKRALRSNRLRNEIGAAQSIVAAVNTGKSIARRQPIGDKLDGDDLHPSTAQCDWLRALPAENSFALHRGRRLVGIVRS